MLKKIKNIILQFPKFQIQFLIFLIIIIWLTYILQVNFWAEMCDSYWCWKKYFNLSHPNDWSLLFAILVLLIYSFPIIWIFSKKYRVIFLNVLFSLLYFSIILMVTVHDWFFNCQDFCAMITMIFNVWMILLIWLFSIIILFFIKKKDNAK